MSINYAEDALCKWLTTIRAAAKLGLTNWQPDTLPDGQMDRWTDGWTDRLADGTTDGLLGCWAFFQPPNDRHFIIVSFGECVIHHANNRSFLICPFPQKWHDMLSLQKWGKRIPDSVISHLLEKALSSVSRFSWWGKRNAIKQVDINRFDFQQQKDEDGE